MCDIDSCAACMNVLWHVRMYYVSKYVHYEAGVHVLEVKGLRQVSIASRRVLVMIPSIC